MTSYIYKNIWTKMIKWRVNMSLFGENYQPGKAFVLCPLCQNHRDFPFYSFICPTVTQRLTIYGKYCDMSLVQPKQGGLTQTYEDVRGDRRLKKKYYMKRKIMKSRLAQLKLAPSALDVFFLSWEDVQVCCKWQEISALKPQILVFWHGHINK